MKYSVISLSTGQVLVDKSRKPNDDEFFVWDDGRSWTVNQRMERQGMDFEGCHPILASSWAIHPNVPLFVPVENKSAGKTARGYTKEEMKTLFSFAVNIGQKFPNASLDNLDYEFETGLSKFHAVPTAYDVETEKLTCSNDQCYINGCIDLNEPEKCIAVDVFRTLPHPYPELQKQGYKIINVTPIY